MIIWKKSTAGLQLNRPAIFLDRDGVINEENSYISCVGDLHIYDYVKDCVNVFHSKGYYVIVISNQSGVARGIIQESNLAVMNELIGKQTDVDAIYCCPHYKEGIVKKYAVSCDCRKPKTGLVKQAMRDFRIDLAGSYMVGDRANDILMGERLGVKTALVKTGYGIERLETIVYPDYIFDDLRQFAQFLNGI